MLKMLLELIFHAVQLDKGTSEVVGVQSNGARGAAFRRESIREQVFYRKAGHEEARWARDVWPV